MGQLDTDRSGTIDMNEFLKWWCSDSKFRALTLNEKQSAAIQQAATYFQYFDKNTSGAIDQVEFESMFNDMVNYGYFGNGLTCDVYSNLAGDAFNEMKVDGEISFNNYIQWLLRKGHLFC